MNSESLPFHCAFPSITKEFLKFNISYVLGRQINKVNKDEKWNRYACRYIRFSVGWTDNSWHPIEKNKSEKEINKPNEAIFSFFECVLSLNDSSALNASYGKQLLCPMHLYLCFDENFEFNRVIVFIYL